MAWEDTLQDASFKGLDLHVLRIEDAGGHDVARHAFPYRAGQETEDLGAKAWDIRVSAMVWGDDYEYDLNDLIAALEEDGSGDLVHPIYGVLNCQVLDYRIAHEADGVDQCRIDITFCETDEPKPVFQQLNPRQAAAAVVESDEEVTDVATEAYVDDMEEPSLGAQLNALRSTLQKTIGQIYGQVRGIVQTALDVINFPRLLVSDLIQGVAAILALPESLDPDKIFSQWRSLSDDAKALLQLPNGIANNQPLTGRFASQGSSVSTGRTSSSTGSGSASGSGTGGGSSGSESGVNEGYSSYNALSARTVSATALRPFNRLMAAVVVSQYAATVGELLSIEAASATLSPTQIEIMVNDVRSMMETLIQDLQGESSLETVNKLERYRPVIEALKNQALILQQAAQAIIELRPPLIERTVTSTANLHLIAHIWYGDHRRATELLRLNPQIRQPNFVLAGAVLMAYAE